MNIIDITIMLLLIMFALIGWKQGIIKETVSCVGIIIIFIVAFTFKEEIGNILCKYLPFFKFSGNIEGLISLNIFIYQLIGFLLIYIVLFSAYQLILTLSGILQKIVNMTIILALPSKLGGAIVGVLKGYIIIFAILMVILVPLKDFEMISESKMINNIVHKTPLLSTYTKTTSDTINSIYELADSLTNNTITVNQANLEIIDTMLKYDIVSKKTVEQLVVLDKLKTIEGLDNVLKRY